MPCTVTGLGDGIEDYDTVFVLKNPQCVTGKQHKASGHYERAVSIGVREEDQGDLGVRELWMDHGGSIVSGQSEPCSESYKSEGGDWKGLSGPKSYVSKGTFREL